MIMSKNISAINPGKGDEQRPRAISWREFSDRWDAVFSRRKKCCGNKCGCHTEIKDENPIIVKK